MAIKTPNGCSGKAVYGVKSPLWERSLKEKAAAALTHKSARVNFAKNLSRRIDKRFSSVGELTEN